MKKVFIVFLILTMSSCLVPGAPHGHETVCITDLNSEVKIWVSCYPRNKDYRIGGIEKGDTVYISSAKIKTQNNIMKQKYFLCGDSLKSYRIRIGDGNYHRNLLDDTIKLKIVKPDSSYKLYNFLVVKDGKIRS